MPSFERLTKTVTVVFVELTIILSISGAKVTVGDCVGNEVGCDVGMPIG